MPPHAQRAAWTTMKPSSAVKSTGISATRTTRLRHAADGLTRPLPAGSSLRGESPRDSRARLREAIKEGHTAITKAARSSEPPRTKTSKHVSTRSLLAPSRVVGVLDLPASRKKLKIKRVQEHPLSKEFKDTTVSYSDELAEAAGLALDVAHEKLVKRLHGEADDEAEALETNRMLDEAIKAATSSFKPLADEKVAVSTVGASGETNQETYTLQQRVERFEGMVKLHEANISKITKEHTEVLKQIAAFVTRNLGASVPDSLAPGAQQMHKLVKELEQDIEGLGETELEELRNEKKQDQVKMKMLTEILQAMN